MATRPSSVVHLARQILRHAEVYERHFQARGRAVPDPLDAGAYPEPHLPGEVLRARQELLQASLHLQDQVRGPADTIHSTARNYNRLVSLQAITRFDLARRVPPDGTPISFGALAQACGIGDTGVLQRLLRHAMAFHIFREPEPGVVAHTAASKALADQPGLHEWVKMITDEMWPAATRVIDAIQASPGSTAPTSSGFNLAHAASRAAFDEIARSPERQACFSRGMAYFQQLPGFQAAPLLAARCWKPIADRSDAAVLVDLGGSVGNFSIALARQFPQLHCIVQDAPAVVERAHAPPDVQDRVSFMAHDLFDAQPVVGAEVYFLRSVLHNWSDENCAKILRALVPALQPGSRLLINECCLPSQAGVMPAFAEQALRSLDLSMLALLNARERDADAWKTLLQYADKRFKLQNIEKLPQSPMVAIEVVWDDGETALPVA